jgi:putative transposase
MHTPTAVHQGHAARLHQVRADVLAGAYAAHPERFVKRPPTPRPVPAEVWINRPAKEVPQA